MKGLILVTLMAAATVFAQQDINVKGREIVHDGSVTKARGAATITNSTVRIQADSIDYNQSTGEAVATGNVRIKFLTKSAVNTERLPGPSLEERMRLMKQRFPPDIVRQ